MAYVRTTWENLPSENTPINASNLNKIENGIYQNSINIGELVDLNTTNKTNIVNAINELKSAETYSINEIKTNKIWIDNKPIYRKVIEFGTLPNATAKTVNHNISNIDKITYQYAIASASDGLTYTIPHVGASNMGNGMTMALRSNKEWIQIYCSSNMTSYTGYYILEYTKTTD